MDDYKERNIFHGNRRSGTFEKNAQSASFEKESEPVTANVESSLLTIMRKGHNVENGISANKA